MKKLLGNKKALRAVIIAVVCASVVAAGLCIFGVFSDGRTDYSLSLTLDSDAMTLRAAAKIDYKNNTGAELDNIKFNLYANAFREGAAVKPYFESDVNSAYPDGVNYGGMEIKSVRAENDLQYSVSGKDKNVLDAKLDKPLKKGGKKTVEIVYELKIPKTNMRFGYYGGIINLTNFFPSVCVYENGGFVECLYLPTGDPFYSETADFKVELRTDREYTAAHSGDLKSEKTEGKGKIFKFTGEKIRDFALCLSEKFEVKTAKSGNTTVKYFALKESGEESAIRLGNGLQTAKNALDFFGGYYFKYPYKTYCVAETYLTAGGMEYPNLVLISRALREKDKEAVVVHETAHQWFYGIVGNDNLNHAWMDEGLSEFSTELYFLRNGKPLKANEYHHFNLGESRRFEEIVREINPGNVSMDKNIGDFVSNYEYVALTYSRGHMMFSDICRILGNEPFQKAMRLYVKRNKYKIAKKTNLVDALNECAQKDIRADIAKWINL
ncbi:MAG: M1 family metallopeptidase [Clostridiales bacterium]|jgi:hypothetical protein|nr:M1 family metallopeptidase [Clostridiales bacterium]